jgi:hypothetical protein
VTKRRSDEVTKKNGNGASPLPTLSLRHSATASLPSYIEAAVSPPSVIEMVGPVNLEAAAPVEAGSSAPAKARKFSMEAYSGGPMRVGFWRHPIVLDLAGLTLRAGAKIYLDHDRSARVGHVDAVENNGERLTVRGVVSSTSAAAQEVCADADNGYPWQASVGATVDAVDFIAEGSSVKVNGREIQGPANVARKSSLAEVSFVGNGADEHTSATIAATRAANQGDITMTFEQWLKAKGFEDSSKLSEAQHSALEAMWKAEKPAEKPAETPAAPAAKPVQASASTDIDAVIARMKREKSIRDMGVRALEASGNPEAGDAIKATIDQSIAEGWEMPKIELALVRLGRAPIPPVQDFAPAGNEIEAALAIAGGLGNLEKRFHPDVLNRAQSHFPRGLSLVDMLVVQARAHGWTGHTIRGNLQAIQRAAFMPRDVQAGYSLVDTAGILSATANKFLLEGFFQVERTWRNICAVRNVPDLKTITSYRLIGKDQYEEVGPTGELYHGTLGEDTYTNQAKTYGLLLDITRTDMLNDDLGAITTVPRKLGRGSGLKINDVFWKTWLLNASGTFFCTGNKNYMANYTLSIDNLTLGEIGFMDMVDKSGKPTGVMPSILLVPTALSAMATALFKSQDIRDNTASSKYPIANTHQGKFRPEVSRYLSNTTYTNASSLAWYLLASPSDLAAIEVAFLNGQEAPTIETAEAAFNTLGIQMRGYHDFGVALQDPRAGYMSKGAA